MSSFRVLTKKRARTSYKLGELNDDPTLCAYKIIKDILIKNTGKPLDNPDTKLIVSIPNGNLTFDDKKRVIYGFVNAGRYGETYTVRDKRLTTTSPKKINHDEVTEKKRFIFMYIPDSLDTGIIAFHESDRLSARTPMKMLIESGFLSHAPSLEARVMALLHEKIPKYVKESDVTEIKAVGYKVDQATEDAIRLLGNRTTAEFVIRNKGYSMGKVSDYLNKSKSQNGLLDLIEPNSEKIKITAQVNGKPKVYELDNILAKGIAINIDDSLLDLDPITKEPSDKKLLEIMRSEVNDYIGAIYGKGYSI